jgi:adenylosuccinate lyase
MVVAEAVSTGAPNDLLDRLSRDEAFRSVPAARLQAELDPMRYTGRSASQVDEFLVEYLAPLLERARPLASVPESAEVRV